MSNPSAKGMPARNSDVSDAELFLACRNGKENAWEELVERYQRLIATIPRRAGLTEEQVSDVFQDVFMTLLEKIQSIEQPEKIRSWLVTTTKFKTWAIVNGRHDQVSIDDEDNSAAFILSDDSPLADDKLIELEQQHIIRTALGQLEERCRTILTMLYLKDPPSSYLEVAEKIGVGETSISPLRARCLNKIAKILSNEK